jgi:hypothetical protein
MSLRRMMMFTLGGVNLVTQIINNLKSFIATITVKNGVTFEAEACTSTDLTDLQNQNLLESANFIVLPNNTTEAEIIPTLPVPTDNIRNLLFRSEGSTTSWTSNNVVAVATSSIVDPAGTQRVVRVTETVANNVHNYNQSIPNLYGYQGDVYSFSTYLKKGDGAGAPDIIQLSYGNGYGNFNINTGTATASGSVFGASMQNAGSGWWRCIISGSFTNTVTNNPSAFIGFVNNSPSASLRPSYAGATNRNIFIYGSQFELSLTASAYQPAPVHPRLPSNYASFISTSPGNYWVNSSGNLQNTPYENIIWPSVRISSVSSGTAWRWIDVALGRASTGVSDPNGTRGATRLNQGVNTRNDYFMSYQTSGTSAAAPSFSSSKIRTLILYVKQDSTDRYLGIKLANGGNTGEYNNNAVTIKVDCSNGTLANNPTNYTITYTSQSIGNGWYKVCINRADTWDSILFQSSQTLATMDNTAGGVLIWGVQVLNGVYDINTPTYQRELGYAVPRLDYSGSNCPDYLIERSSFNTLIRSEEFASSSVWVTSSMNVTSNTETAPNGELTADTLIATATTASIRQSGTTAATQVARTFSVYLKRKTGTGDVYLNMRNTASTTTTASLSTGSWTRAFVNDTALTGTYTVTSGNHTITTATPHGFSTGDAILFDATTGGAPDASIASITVTGATTFTFTNGAATSSGNCTIYSNTGRIILSTNGDEVYAWGAQLEPQPLFTTAGGRIPTSYIPTTTAQVTRAGESLATNFSGSVSSSLYFELNKIGGSNSIATPYLFIGNETSPASSTDGLGLAGSANGVIAYAKKENNGTNTSLGSLVYTPADNTTVKILFTTSGSSVNLWMDGTLLNTTTFANPNNLDYITLDSTSANTSTRLSKVISWPTTLTRQNIDSLFAYPYYNAGYTPVNYELQDVINRAYAEGFTLPSTTTLGYCDTLITEMKNDGVWNVTDLFLNFAFNDTNLTNFSRINWRNPNSKLNGISSLFGGLTYQTNGFKGNGVNGYIDTLINPSPAINIPYNYTLNNAGRLLVISEDVTGGNTVYEGNTGTSTRMGAFASSLSAFTSNTVNSAAATIDTRGVGLKSIMRDTSTNIRIQNGATTLSTTQTSTAITNNTQMLLRFASSYSNACISNYYFGASLTNLQISNFRTYYNTFLTNIGLTAFA